MSLDPGKKMKVLTTLSISRNLETFIFTFTELKDLVYFLLCKIRTNHSETTEKES